MKLVRSPGLPKLKRGDKVTGWVLLVLLNLAGALLSLTLGGCASQSWRTGSVWIETVSQGVEVQGASCTVSNDSVQRTIVTPDTIVLPTKGDMRIVCDKPGFARIDILQHPAFDPGPGSSTLGIGLGGFNGNLGLGLDLSLPLGGRRGGYPQRMTIELQALPSQPPAIQPQAK